MPEIAQNIGSDSIESAQPKCAYCGAILYPSFYFCLKCATPYKSIESVVAPVQPIKLSESELIKQKVPNVWRVFWTYAVVLFVSILAYAFLFSGENELAYGIIFTSLAFLATTIVFEIIYWKSLVVQLKNFGFSRKEAWIGFLIMAGMLVINFFYSQFLQLFAEEDLACNNISNAGFGSIAIFLFFCLLPGITEEIGFRGLIQHWLQTALKPWRAIILASALFAAMHLSIPTIPYLFFVGMLLGWVKWKTGSLYPSMALHIIHNAVVLFVFPFLI